MKKIISALAAIALMFILVFMDFAGIDINQLDTSSSGQFAITTNSEGSNSKYDTDSKTQNKQSVIDEDGSYFDKENVALYIHIYGKLPANFITKDEARDLGWEGGSVEKYAPAKPSAATDSATMKASCQRKRAAPTPNVILIQTAITAAAAAG